MESHWQPSKYEFRTHDGVWHSFHNEAGAVRCFSKRAMISDIRHRYICIQIFEVTGHNYTCVERDMSRISSYTNAQHAIVDMRRNQYLVVYESCSHTPVLCTYGRYEREFRTQFEPTRHSKFRIGNHNNHTGLK
ncbi:hypothetical protein CLF_103078 [Clonorchis sinensis]|uniref:Uncharacterized protein n=1 Tax=Clonorchis sinensis TaxID=79923 RepID=G7Y912_CLOSI|nr:hypothetical protein CLF_103078 [Clonorchis sinensis]